MAQLDFQQVHNLADNFLAMAKAIGAYRYNNPGIDAELDQKINESHKSILKYATKLYTVSAIIIIADEEVQNSMSAINDITTQIKGTYARLQTVQKAIDVAASIVALGAALFSKDPTAVGKSINDLVNIWSKSIPSIMRSASPSLSGNKETNIALNKIDGFDVHCHIFNLSYILREIKTMFFDWVTGKYPAAEKSKFITKEEQDKSKNEFRKKLFRLIELLSSTVRREKGNFKYIQSQVNDAWGISIGAIPLMMDIYYIFAPPITKNDFDVPHPRSIDYRSAIINEKEFEDEFAEEIKKFARSLKNKNKSLIDYGDFASELDRQVEDCVEDSEYKYETRSIIYGNLKMTSGYRLHLDRLKSMVLEGEPIFPFLAVDPRREGVFEALKNEMLIGKKGPFYGVKLYPRLGYHPASKPVQDILNICIERDLPVTTHCGMSGFPPGDFSFDGTDIWKYNDFGNPEHFESALKKGLRIDFAHLGSSDPSFKWAKTIVSFMEKYKNVYSDLSCYTNREELKEIIKLFADNRSFKKRIMYGSDFDVMYFTDKKISMEQYCRNFSDLFPKEIDNMRNRNVLAFLNL